MITVVILKRAEQNRSSSGMRKQYGEKRSRKAMGEFLGEAMPRVGYMQQHSAGGNLRRSAASVRLCMGTPVLRSGPSQADDLPLRQEGRRLPRLRAGNPEPPPPHNARASGAGDHGDGARLQGRYGSGSYQTGYCRDGRGCQCSAVL